MKKRSFFVIILLIILLRIDSVKGLTIGDCQVLASYKLSSSLDADKYICKDQKFGNIGEGIYYSGEGNTISLNNFSAYYFSTWDKFEVTLDLSGENNISMLHVGESVININGIGSLKFKEDSFVKMVINGEMVYSYVYNDKTIITNDGLVYESTLNDFKNNYEALKVKNGLPEEFNENDYILVQAIDYVSMTSVSVTDSWVRKHIKTTLNTSVVDGYGIVKYVKPVEEKKEEPKKEVESTTKKSKVSKKSSSSKSTTLKTDKVVLISDKKLNSKYKLNVSDLNDKKSEYNKKIKDYDIVSLYDVAVYNGKKEVQMKDNSFVIKIKLEEKDKDYDNYKIIYVDDNGEVAEYIDGTIEDGYIVFKTTHLSQYGVIGQIEKKEVLEQAVLEPEKNNNIGNILKIGLIIGIALPLTGLIGYLVIKSYNLQKNKRA